MNTLQRAIKSVLRKPIRSILLLLVVMVISNFFMASLASHSASIQVADSTRQAVGATFRLEENEQNRHTRLEAATKMANDTQEGEYGGVSWKMLPDGSWAVYTDNSFETIKKNDVLKIADNESIKNYNLTTVPTVVNPKNFMRIEDSNVDQSGDVGGVNLRGNLLMEMDMDVEAGKIEIVEGDMIRKGEENVCVISAELAELNGLNIGEVLDFNNYHDRVNSKIYSAKIVGIYRTTQKIKSIMSGDSYRSENTIFTDLSFPEKPSGDEGNPLYQYAIFEISNIDQYEQVKEEIQQVNIDWSRYDLIDNSGNIKSMAENFNGMDKISEILLLLVSASGFTILILIFTFWLKNRTQEIGIFMALGIDKVRILIQVLCEAALIGLVGIMLSMATVSFTSNITASYLARQTQTQAAEDKKSNASKVATDYVDPDLSIQKVEIDMTAKMIVVNIGAVLLILVISVSLASIRIMRKSPKEILSDIS